MHKWRKLGRIFNVSGYTFNNVRGNYAQSPQALEYDDFVRVYFCTRKEDLNRKYLSNVAYVDFSKDFLNILKVSEHQVMALGDLGTFDEHGIFPFSPFKFDGRFVAYTCGWSRRFSVSVETGVGLVESFDEGETFQRLGNGPILSASLNEPCLVGDAYVKSYDGIFHMWYMFGMGWQEFTDSSVPERIYKIGHATSKNGLEWQKQEGVQIIPSKIGNFECQALPTVIKIDDAYHMYFCYRYPSGFRSDPAKAYRIGHAISSDLKCWERQDDELNVSVSESGWDSQMICYPNVFELEGRIYLLYNGNNFGRDGFGLAVLE